MKTGSVQSIKCDLTNSAKYSSGYITSKKVPAGTNIFVDFSFTLDHPVIEKGTISVVLDGMVKPTEESAYTKIYVSAGLTPVSSYINATWASSDTIEISGYKSSSAAPTVTFTA